VTISISAHISALRKNVAIEETQKREDRCKQNGTNQQEKREREREWENGAKY